MDETLSPQDDNEKSIWIKDPADRTTAEKILVIIAERETKINILMDPGSMLSEGLEKLGVREQYIDLLREEVETLRALDPNTVTSEEVGSIAASYHAHLDALRSSSSEQPKQS